MSFDWNDFFTLADGLMNNPKVFLVEEASFRSVISRAYYSAFCNARNTAIAKHRLILGPKDNAHRVVADHFSKRASNLEKQIGRHLARLRKRRNEADYNDLISPPGTPAGLAQEALELARRILADLPKVQ